MVILTIIVCYQLFLVQILMSEYFSPHLFNELTLSFETLVPENHEFSLKLHISQS